MSVGTVERRLQGAGRHRAVVGFLATLRISAVVQPSELPFLSVGIGLRVLQFGVLTAIWRSLPEGQVAASGMTVAGLLTYTLVAQAAGPVLMPQTSLTAHVANGTLAVRLLWPMGVVSQFVAEMLGRTLPFACAGAVAVVAAAAALGVPLTGAGSVPLSLVSLVLAVVVGLAVDFWFALLTVQLGNGVWFVNAIRAACTSVISGSLIPLTLMPWHIGDVLGLLPFAAMASGPLRVYTQDSGAAGLLASQAVWAVVLWVGIVRWARRSRDKVVGYGG